MSYFRRHHHRRFSPVIHSPSSMGTFAYEQPIQEQQNVVHDQPRRSYTYRTQRFPLSSLYSDVDQPTENFDPQRPLYLFEPQWNLPAFQQSISVDPNSQIQSSVPIHSHRYYYEEAPPSTLVPQAPALLHDSPLPYTTTNLPQTTSETAIQTTVCIVRADGSVVYEIIDPHQNCDAEGCHAMEDPTDERLQDGLNIEHPPTRGTPPAFVRQPCQSSDEEIQDEEQSHDTVGATGSIEGQSLGLSRDEILDELELLVSAMRQLLLEYRDLSMAGEEEPSEEEDIIGKDHRTENDEHSEDSGEEGA